MQSKVLGPEVLGSDVLGSQVLKSLVLGHRSKFLELDVLVSEVSGRMSCGQWILGQMS